MKAKIINVKELGINCWEPVRFCNGGRCERVHLCNYPEKKNCKAVVSEIVHLAKVRQQSYDHTTGLIDSLVKMKGG